MWTFYENFIKLKKKNLNKLFQTGDFVAIREKGKLRDLGMVFKPSFKCFKNEKISFIQVILKLECLYIISSLV